MSVRDADEHDLQSCGCGGCADARASGTWQARSRSIDYSARERYEAIRGEGWDARPSRLQQAQELRHSAKKLREEADQKERVADEIEGFEALLDAEYGPEIYA